MHSPFATHPDAPLQVHARYSRIEILAAFGLRSGANIFAWQSGVYEAKAANAELLAFTLASVGRNDRLTATSHAPASATSLGSDKLADPDSITSSDGRS